MVYDRILTGSKVDDGGKYDNVRRHKCSRFAMMVANSMFV